MVFFLATSLTSSILITERNEGVWDRSIVAGTCQSQNYHHRVQRHIFCLILRRIIFYTNEVNISQT
jgi:hypothetical protein